MLEKFLSYLQSNCLTDKHNRILVAVSGGIDSICMLHILHNLGFEIAVAHCNFKLRSYESDEDELFVKSTAEKLHVPFHVKHFETLEYAKLQKMSIQMAARELRFSWFENLRRIIDYDKIAIAHNADDSIETFFINLTRGTGIQGISGIKPINNNIIRPLLFAFRSEIEEYCSNNNIIFRTDSSNLSNKYLRNKLRNTILPYFVDMNHEFKTTMLQNIGKFEKAENIYCSYIDQIKKELIIKKDDNEIRINIEGIDNTVSPTTILYEIMKEYGFSAKTSEEIYSALHGESGKQFISKEYRVLKDRNFLIINKLSLKQEGKYFIFEDTLEINTPLAMTFRVQENLKYQIQKNPLKAALDFEKLTFPLVLRKWYMGDYFQPMGMTGLKKLSDFFIDNKLSITDKENTWILTSANEIVWVVGMRIDDKYKVTSETQKIYEIEAP
jgi:tRNA(Ile)-lysidine synthase